MEIKVQVKVLQIGDCCDAGGGELGLGAMLDFSLKDCDNEPVFVPLPVEKCRELAGVLYQRAMVTITFPDAS